MQALEQIPDSVKVVASTAAPALSFIGIPVQEWGYLLSAIVAILFIIEKIPSAAKSLRELFRFIKDAFKSKK
jgi:hypothetical protein